MHQCDGVLVDDDTSNTREGHILRANLDHAHPAQLVLGLRGGDAVHEVVAFGLAGLVDLEHIALGDEGSTAI